MSHWDEDPDNEDDLDQSTAPAPTPSPADTQTAWQREQIQKAYQKYLKRDPTPSEYYPWLQGGPNRINDLYNFLARQAPAAPPAPPPTADTPSGDTTTPADKAGDYRGFGKAWLASGGKTPAALAAFAAAHPGYGAEIFGTKKNKVRIGGKAFDAIRSTSGSNPSGSWDEITRAGGVGAGGEGGMTLASVL